MSTQNVDHVFSSSRSLPLSVFDVNYTPTADFVMSASDDGNVRIWKSNASAKMGPVSTKERQAIEYRQSLVERWSTVKDVRSVKERRHVPASIHNAVAIKRDMIESRKVKEDRRRKHTRAGQDKPKAERKSESVRASLDRTLIDENRRSCHCRAEVVFGPRSDGPVNSDTDSDSITPYDHLMNLTLTHAPGFGLFGRMNRGRTGRVEVDVVAGVATDLRRSIALRSPSWLPFSALFSLV